MCVSRGYLYTSSNLIEPNWTLHTLLAFVENRGSRVVAADLFGVGVDLAATLMDALLSLGHGGGCLVAALSNYAGVRTLRSSLCRFARDVNGDAPLQRVENGDLIVKDLDVARTTSTGGSVLRLVVYKINGVQDGSCCGSFRQKNMEHSSFLQHQRLPVPASANSQTVHHSLVPDGATAGGAVGLRSGGGEAIPGP